MIAEVHSVAHRIRVGSVAVTLPIVALLSCEPAPEPQEGDFRNLFEQVRTVELVGTAEAPILAGGATLVRGDRVYLTDSLGHALLVFGRDGSLVRRVGGKGDQPGLFHTPHGLAVDGASNVYVNDRGNRRVQRFDSSLTVDRVIDVEAETESIFLANGSGGELLFAVGTTACAGKTCLAQKLLTDGARLRTFAPLEKAPVIYSWSAAVDGDARLYLANTLGYEVEVYEASGELGRRIPLVSPSMVAFEGDGKEEPADWKELRERMRELKTREHTRVQGLFLTGGALFVALQRRNDLDGGDSEFLLDLYDREGRLRIHGIEVPGLLRQVDGTSLYFTEEDRKARYGAVTLSEYRWKKAPPWAAKSGDA